MRVANAGSTRQAAAYAARLITGHIREALRARQQANIALSGGASAVALLEALADMPVDWPAVHIFQVDERVVPRGDAARNLTAVENILVNRGAVSFRQLRPLWVDRADLAEAATSYGDDLTAAAGKPPVLDVVHLGLGEDGHTASLFPGDDALSVTSQPVALTGVHAGHRRLTLTYPVINRARAIVWLVMGANKAERVRDLVEGRGDFPAAAVSRGQAVLVVDSGAAGLLPRPVGGL